MSHKVTVSPAVAMIAAFVFALLPGDAFAQRTGPQARRMAPDWRRIGNSALELELPSVATGPVSRVWYAANGESLSLVTASGKTFQTIDFEAWKPSDEKAPGPEEPPASPSRPEAGAQIRVAEGMPGRAYAAGRFAWRSDDGGVSWNNLTAFKQNSILGGALLDIAVSPTNPDEISVANAFGVWRSLDGGLSWAGLNKELPNLPVRRILALPAGNGGARVLLDDLAGAGPLEVRWSPGEKTSWKPSGSSEYAQELALRSQLSAVLDAEITAVSMAGTMLYAGSADGRLWVSPDQGLTWPPAFVSGGGMIESIYADAANPRLALAALGSGPGPRVLRTISGGSFWDDLTANLGSVAVYRLAADRGTGAVYAATASGVYYTFADLQAAGPATAWAPAGENLPKAPVRDVRLDAGRNQLYAAVEGYGVYVAIAPHRFAELRVVSAADFSERPAAPGSLLSVLGGRISAARAGELGVPVLDANENSSQIQVPFEASGNSLSLALESVAGLYRFGLALQRVAPALFVDPDGTPFVIDAASGVMLNATAPARSGSRLQLLAAGLGRVRPDWPTGLPAPLENPPEVAATIRAFLDRVPLSVHKATLAPGYVGFYLVEVELPDLVNAGAADLFIEADGQASNHVRIHIEP
jgi:uncharacterized protein (TIGR03437 family)